MSQKCEEKVVCIIAKREVIVYHEPERTFRARFTGLVNAAHKITRWTIII